MFVVLGLGSNRNFESHTSLEILSKAIERIGSFVENLCVSSIYKTGAMYVLDQDDFYNMVCAGEFRGTPRELLCKIHIIEAELGRNRSNEIRNGPRSIDIDIEFFGKEFINEIGLIIPHEKLTERAFVLKPLLEILQKNKNNADKEIADIPFEIDFLKEKLSALGDQRIELLSV